MSKCRRVPTHDRRGLPLPLKLPVIAFGHQSRVGKDTAAQGVCAAVHGAERYAFADSLKAAATQLFGRYGVKGRDYYEANPAARTEPIEGLSSGMTYVELLVHLGKSLRAIHADVWVDTVLWATRLNPTPLLVISDLRFPNEAAAVRAAGGWCVKVERPGGGPVHGSDAEIPPSFEWDAVLVNDGTREQLQHRAAELALDYLKGTQRHERLLP